MKFIGQYFDEANGFSGPFFGESREEVWVQIAGAVEKSYNMPGAFAHLGMEQGIADVTKLMMMGAEHIVHWNIAESPVFNKTPAERLEYIKKWRANRTPEQIEKHRLKAAESARMRIANMSEQERAEHREAGRVAMKKWRAANRKVAENVKAA